MLNEKELEKQKKIAEIIKKYIKPDLLTKNWDTDGLIVTI